VLSNAAEGLLEALREAQADPFRSFEELQVRSAGGCLLQSEEAGPWGAGAGPAPSPHLRSCGRQLPLWSPGSLSEGILLQVARGAAA